MTLPLTGGYPDLKFELIEFTGMYVRIRVHGIQRSDEAAILATHQPLMKPATLFIQEGRLDVGFAVPRDVMAYHAHALEVATDLLHNIRAFRLVRGWGNEGVPA